MCDSIKIQHEVSGILDVSNIFILLFREQVIPWSYQVYLSSIHSRILRASVRGGSQYFPGGGGWIIELLRTKRAEICVIPLELFYREYGHFYVKTMPS